MKERRPAVPGLLRFARNDGDDALFLKEPFPHDRHHRLFRHERGRHRFRTSVRHDRRAHQPDRPQVARGRNDGGGLQSRGRRGARPGRGGSADARHQRRHPARRRAEDPRRMHQARSGDGRRAALDRLFHRRGAGGWPRRLQGEAPRQFGHRRRGAARARAAAHQEIRRGGNRDLERRDRHFRGPGPALCGRQEDRRARL